VIAGKPGELEIDQAEAEIVRRIFREFVAGKTPREIAAGLDANRIKPPRGKNWDASTINGNAARGHGMLINELYAGRIVWNKVRMLKDPATGRRVPRPNHKDQYRSVDAPHLAASQSRKAVRPLSGLLRCGSCGAGMSAIGAQRKGKPHRMQCSAFRESSVCSNGRKVSRQAIETLVFEGLREELANPEAIAEYIRTYNAPGGKTPAFPFPHSFVHGSADRLSSSSVRNIPHWRERRPRDVGHCRGLAWLSKARSLRGRRARTFHPPQQHARSPDRSL
jgi:site-specific DNA recombinase